MHAVGPGRSPELAQRRQRAFAAAAILCATAGAAHGEDVSAPAILQWFETTYHTMERRAGDVFAAGYGSVWTPPPGRADSHDGSVGYDVYDRFDLGHARRHTLYGTELGLKNVAATFDRIGVDLHVDFVFNHNGFSGTGDNTSRQAFQNAGDYPGFVLSMPGDADGDFHGAFETGDWYERTSGLIDIAHEKNHRFIRSPVPGFANNIPAGTAAQGTRIADVPTESNRRFYTDRDGGFITVSDPATGASNLRLYSFNTADPMTGDPVEENATGYLMRNARWLVEEIGVDGFRIDAAKHVPQWALNYFDQAVFRASPRLLLDGSEKRVFSYGEVLTGDVGHLQSYIRKDAFNPSVVGGNRDVLDVALFDQFKANLSGNGLANDWAPIVNGGLDAADGLHNGSSGVMFAASHDTTGPDLPNVAHAYILMHPGNAIVYFNGKEFGDGRDFPKDGRGDALGGVHGDAITTLVKLRNTHGRGDYRQRLLTKELHAYERDRAAVVLLSNRLDNGFDSVTVQTGFASGTPLIELTGNAADPSIDPFNDIPELVIVNGDGTINARIPRNRSAAGLEHKSGYVVYGLSGPQGALSLSGVSHTIAPDAGNSASNGSSRLSAIDVVKGDSFTVNLNTNAVNLLGFHRDRDADGDNALLKLDAGLDLNGNGHVDHVAPGSVVYGFEEFTTLRQPGFSQPDGDGQYQQTIDATQLAEGYHFLEARAFRRRADGGPAIYTPFKKTVYVDRFAPVSAIASFDPIAAGINENRDAIVRSLDNTAEEVHILLNVPAARTDAQILASIGSGTGAGRIDRNLFAYGLYGLGHGNQVLTVVTKEISGTASVQRFPGLYTSTIFGQGFGDLDFNGQTNAADVSAFDQVLTSNNNQYNAAAELSGDGAIDLADTFLLGPRLSAVSANQQTWDRYNQLIHSSFVTGGTYTVNGVHDIYEDTARATVVKSGAELTASDIRGATLTIEAGARARVRANGTDNGVSRLSHVEIAPTGQLDLTDNDLIVDYSEAEDNPFAAIRSFVIDGRITSSTAAGDEVLALVDNAKWGRASFGIQSIDTTTIIGKYTYFGDANLDGKVTGDDYVAIDSNLGTGDSWLEGDFNMDGRVTGDDYVAIDSNLGRGTSDPLAFAELKAEMVALHIEMFGQNYLSMLTGAEADGFRIVPEPHGLLLPGLLSALLLRRPGAAPAADEMPIDSVSTHAFVPAIARRGGVAGKPVSLPRATHHEVSHVS